MIVSRESFIQSIYVKYSKIIIYGCLYQRKFHATMVNLYSNNKFLLCLKSNCTGLLICMCFTQICKIIRTDMNLLCNINNSKTAVVNWCRERHMIKPNVQRIKVSTAHMTTYDTPLINCLGHRMRVSGGILRFCIFPV